MSLNWNVVANLTGPAGFSTLSGSGAPANTLGKVGDIYVDTTNAALYPAKTASGWGSAYKTLVGPVTQQVLPNDLTANSLVLAPVSGDAAAVQLLLKNNTGTQFSLDGNGNVVANTATVAALTSSGIANATTFVSAPGALGAPAFSFNSQIDTGMYLPSNAPNAAVLALVVNATQALRLTAAGLSVPGTLTVAGQTNLGAVSAGALTASSLINTGSGTAAGFLSSLAGQASAPAYSFTAQNDTGVYLATQSATAAVLGLAVNGTQALALSKGGATVPGTLNVGGAATLQALTAAATSVASLTASGAGSFGGLLTVPSLTISGSGGQITFADGTTQTTAAMASNATYAASGNGTAAAPVFTYKSQSDTGQYLATASGTAAVLGFSVNATQALALSKTGATVPGTLTVAGQTNLGAIVGSSTLAVSGAANLGATTLASLNVTGNAQVQGATTLGALTATSSTTTGTTKAAALTITASGGALTFGDGSTQTTAAATPNVGVSPTFSATQAGSVNNPSFLFSAQTDSGLYLANTSSTAALLAFAVNNTQSLAMSAAGVTVPGTLLVNGTATFGSVNMGSLTLTGNLTVQGNTALQALTVTSLTNSGTTTSQGHTVSANGSAGVPSYSFTAQPDTGMYLPTASTSAAVLGFSANGTLALNVLKGGITVPGTLGVTGASTLGAVSAASLAVSGNETVGGTLSITGLLTASGNTTTPVLTTTQAATVKQISSTNYIVSNVSLPGAFGDGTSYPPSGLSSDSLGNLLLNYMGVPFIRSNNNGYSSAAGNSPGSAFVTSFLSGSYVFNGGGNTLLALSSTNAKYGFTANTVPFTMQALSGNILVLQNGGTAPNYTTQTVGTVSSAGLATFTGVAISSTTGLTFADNTVQTTAFNAGSAGTQSKWTASSTGTTALPAYTFSANTDTGVYLKTSSTSAAVLGLSVNATDAVTLSKTGVSVPGTLGVTGATSLVALTTTGLITAPNITLGTSGKLTFGDGTSLTSAAQGAAPSFTASGNGTVSLPVFTFSNNTDSGMYLATSSTTAAVVALSVNGTNAISFQKTGVYIPGTSRIDGLASFNGGISSNGTVTTVALTLSSSGQRITFGDGTFQTTAASAGSAATFTATAANGGSNTAPLFLSSLATNTGIFFGSSSAVSFAAAGTTVMNVGSTQINMAVPLLTNGTLTINGATSFNGGAVTFANQSMSTGGTWGASSFAGNSGGSLTLPAFNFGNASSNSGFYYASSSVGVAGVQAGVSCLNFTSSLLTLSVPTTTAKTITSTTAAGTPSFVSSQGFKFVEKAMYWNKSYAANATWTAYDPQTTNDGSVSGASDFRFIFPYAGSVTALTLAAGGTTTGTNTVAINKNGSSVYTWSPGSGTNTTTPYVITFAKGTNAFAANDILTLVVSNSTAGEIRYQIRAFIEVGA